MHGLLRGVVRGGETSNGRSGRRSPSSGAAPARRSYALALAASPRRPRSRPRPRAPAPVRVVAECLQDQLLRLDRASIALGGPRGQQRGRARWTGVAAAFRAASSRAASAGLRSTSSATRSRPRARVSTLRNQPSSSAKTRSASRLHRKPRVSVNPRISSAVGPRPRRGPPAPRPAERRRHHLQAGRGQQHVSRRRGRQASGPGQEQLDQDVVDGSARIPRLVGPSPCPSSSGSSTPTASANAMSASMAARARASTTRSTRSAASSTASCSVGCPPPGHRRAAAASGSCRPRTPPTSRRAAQRGAGVSRQLLRAEGPAGADHATAGQRQPLVGHPRPQVQVPVGGQHPLLSSSAPSRWPRTAPSASASRPPSRPPSRARHREHAAPARPAGGQAWMVRPKPLGQLRRRQRPRLAELAEQAGRPRRLLQAVGPSVRMAGILPQPCRRGDWHPQQDRTATWLPMWMSTTAGTGWAAARQGRSELPGRTATYRRGR